MTSSLFLVLFFKPSEILTKALAVTTNTFIFLIFLHFNTQNPVVTGSATRFNVKKLSFCSHNAFVCFEWISNYAVLISLYSINGLALITGTKSVYWAIRAESLNVIHVKCIMLRVNKSVGNK
jgi:hypothetical protein